MSYIFPSKPHELTQFEVDKIVARNNGWVLHEGYYKEGREVYVNPEYKNVSVNSIRWSFDKSTGQSCYQRPLK